MATYVPGYCTILCVPVGALVASLCRQETRGRSMSKGRPSRRVVGRVTSGRAPRTLEGQVDSVLSLSSICMKKHEVVVVVVRRRWDRDDYIATCCNRERKIPQ
ncbi:uncharacterized protein PV07_01446 [Cladophialophora immunda]|uniref:Uncharacterized protein n=1 Tax=Cladophialophora immunda TaxID=569365 RepID=A0A0D2BAT4_9EURO|nr:uncharacterized protein PV07_01446 [Cladophialophora immunda]KIW34682.1 hypothetical protein PV07_01446 [Cladophialophora immunda]